MNRPLRPALTLAVLALASLAAVPAAHAQRAGFARLFRPYHQVALAQLPEVEKELKLTDAQKTKASELEDDLRQERSAIFQDAAGDFEYMREEMTKLNNEIAKEFAAELDEAQNKRLAEVYVQANGLTALFEESVAAAVKLTDEQKKKLEDVRNGQMGSFQGVDWQSLSEEELDKEVTDRLAKQDEEYGAVLTEEQKPEFEKLKGAELKVDLNNLPNPFGG
jgi:Spy/CpxP family protein refolding chaperone